MFESGECLTVTMKVIEGKTFACPCICPLWRERDGTIVCGLGVCVSATVAECEAVGHPCIEGTRGELDGALEQGQCIGTLALRIQRPATGKQIVNVLLRL